jgi:O-antigen/teichoic acid export membrane protein
MLFPAFSKLDAKKDNVTLRNAYQFSIKYAALFVVPAATLVMSLSEPAVSTLFGNAYENAPLFLALLAISYLYVLLGDLSTNNLINSQGQTKFILKLTILTAVIGFPVGSILISQFGVIGLIIISLIDGLPSVFISLYWIKKRYNLTVDWRSSARILLSSAITAIITYVVVTQIEFFSSVRLLLGVLLFFAILIPCMLITRAITVLDINNLRNISSGLGALRSPILLVLKALEKLIRALNL